MHMRITGFFWDDSLDQIANDFHLVMNRRQKLKKNLFKEVCGELEPFSGLIDEPIGPFKVLNSDAK